MNLQMHVSTYLPMLVSSTVPQAQWRQPKLVAAFPLCLHVVECSSCYLPQTSPTPPHDLTMIVRQCQLRKQWHRAGLVSPEELHQQTWNGSHSSGSRWSAFVHRSACNKSFAVLQETLLARNISAVVQNSACRAPEPFEKQPNRLLCIGVLQCLQTSQGKHAHMRRFHRLFFAYSTVLRVIRVFGRKCLENKQFQVTATALLIQQ